MEKLIITVAPTGSLPQKKNTPHVPITPAEIIETAIRCESAGAAILHVHVRNPVDESPSPDYELFEEVHAGLKAKTNLIIQISTGGRAGMGYEQRAERLKLKPEMASLTTGSVNFPNSVYENSPSLIESLAKDMLDYGIKPEMEIFDTSMINNALELQKKGLAIVPLHHARVVCLSYAGGPVSQSRSHGSTANSGDMVITPLLVSSACARKWSMPKAASVVRSSE